MQPTATPLATKFLRVWPPPTGGWAEDEPAVGWVVEKLVLAARFDGQELDPAELEPPVRALWDAVGRWLTDHEADVHAAVLTVTPAGRVRIGVMQREVRFHPPLTDALTDLDIRLATDPQTERLRVSVRQTPRMPADDFERFVAGGD